MDYDAWLEKPYQDREEEGAAFVDWCEENDVYPGADDAWDLWKDAMQGAADDAAERAAEARAEAREFDYEDRF